MRANKGKQENVYTQESHHIPALGAEFMKSTQEALFTFRKYSLT